MFEIARSLDCHPTSTRFLSDQYSLVIRPALAKDQYVEVGVLKVQQFRSLFSDCRNKLLCPKKIKSSIIRALENSRSIRMLRIARCITCVSIVCDWQPLGSSYTSLFTFGFFGFNVRPYGRCVGCGTLCSLTRVSSTRLSPAVLSSGSLQ